MPIIKAVSNELSSSVVRTPTGLGSFSNTPNRTYARHGSPGTAGLISLKASPMRFYAYTPPMYYSWFITAMFGASPWDYVRTTWEAVWDKVGSDPYIFGRELIKTARAGIATPAMFEWWYECGFDRVGYHTWDFVGTEAADNFGLAARAPAEMLTRVFNRRFVIIVDDNTTTETKWSVVYRDPLWEKPQNQEPVYIWAKNPITHVSPSAVPLYELFIPATSREKYELQRVVDEIEYAPTIPLETRLAVVDNRGRPIACYDKDLRIIAEGKFCWRLANGRTRVEYVWWAKIKAPSVNPVYEARTSVRLPNGQTRTIPVLGKPKSTKPAKILRAIPDRENVVFYCRETEVYPRSGGRIALSRAMDKHFTTASKVTLSRVTGDEAITFQRRPTPNTVPMTVPGTGQTKIDSFGKSPENYFRFYQNTNIGFRKAGVVSNTSTPLHLPTPAAITHTPREPFKFATFVDDRTKKSS